MRQMKLFVMLLGISMELLGSATSFPEHTRRLLALSAYNLNLTLTLAFGPQHQQLKSAASGAIILVIVSLIVLIWLQQFEVAKSIEINIIDLSALELVQSCGQNSVTAVCEVCYRSRAQTHSNGLSFLSVIYGKRYNGLFSNPW
jgi:hypothetical protein